MQETPSLAGTLAVGAALQPPGRSAHPRRTWTFWLTGEEARMEPSERNQIEMTGSRVGATSRCSLSSHPNITLSDLPFFFLRSSTLFVCLFPVPGWRWWKLAPILLKVREYANKLRRRGKEAEKGFDYKHHLRWAGLVDVRKKMRFLFLFEAKMKARKVTPAPSHPTPFPFRVIFFFFQAILIFSRIKPIFYPHCCERTQRLNVSEHPCSLF